MADRMTHPTPSHLVELAERPEAIRWVGQEETSGCVAATMAMVLGLDYWSAVALLDEHRHQDCYSGPWAMQIIRKHGWRTEARWRQRDEARNLIAPYPGEPFADLHIVSVKVSAESKLYHSVIWLRDGSVLDPLTPDTRRLSDYHHIAGIHGLHSTNTGRCPDGPGSHPSGRASDAKGGVE